MGNAYITGYTQARNFPIKNPLQANFGGGTSDAFVAKFDPSKSGAASLIYSTYLGGNGLDIAYSIAVDAASNAYVSGYTRSTNFPTANPLQSAFGGVGDVFVAKLNATGSGFIYSTYLGGTDDEISDGLAVDSSGNAFVVGSTRSSNFPGVGARYGPGGGYDIFVAKLTPNGQGAPLGAADLNSTEGNGMAFNQNKSSTRSAEQAGPFVIEIGGSDVDGGHGIAIDSAGDLHVSGYSHSTDFPTANAIQSTFGGPSRDVVVLKIATGTTVSPCAVTPSTIDFGQVGVGTSTNRTFLMTNTGNQPFTISAISSNNAAFSIVNPPLPITVPPGGSVNGTVRMSCTSAGAQTGTLSFSTSSAGGPVNCGTVAVIGSCAGGMPSLYGPITFNLLMESERSCQCGRDAPHSGGIAVASAEECPNCHPALAFSVIPDAGPASVYLHNGEFYLHEVDLEIPGRGFNWKFERKYRSGITYNGPLGQNWEFNYNRRLFVELSGSVLRMDGYGRADRYTLSMGSYTAPPGFYTQLVKNPDGTFTERDRSGTKVFYSTPDGQGIARMTEIRDRNGNRMRFQYNAQGQLVQVIDTLGRPINYSYNQQGQLIEVRDFSGRSSTFQYDQNGDLVAVTSPAVTGTPTGNDFPQGKTTRYSYSSGLDPAVLNHNLLTMTAPNEIASGGESRVRIEYDTNPNSPNLDRVLRQTIGGTNAPAEFADGQIRFRQDVRVPAGGTISYEYQSLGTAPANDFISPVMQTTVINRNGNRREYQFNQLGNIVRIREFTNRKIRPSDPEFFETRFEYNKDGEMIRMIYPEGNSAEYIYDDRNPDRFQQGNRLTEIRRPDPQRGGDQAMIKTSYTYEPIYNLMRSVTEARGNDSNYAPQNGGANSPARYTTVDTFDYQEGQNFAALASELGVSQSELRALLQSANIPTGLGDVNGDGRTDQVAGNVVKVIHPTVNLLPGSNMTRIEGGTQQPIVELDSYNEFGQRTKMVDPEANVTLYDYYPENDPDGDGKDLTPGAGTGPFGYLKQITRDAMSASGRDSGTNPSPTTIRHLYQYDRVGNIIREVDGRGIATDYVVNQLNQVVQIVRAAAHNIFAPDPPEPLPLTDFQYLERRFYDFNNNVIRRQVEDRGNTSGVAADNGGSGSAFVDYESKYDILDKQIEMSEEVSDSEHLITRYRYDPNQNQVLVIQPEGNATADVYDERDLLFQRTRGATSPPPLVLLGAGDPTNYDVRGGFPSTTNYQYDLNRDLVQQVTIADPRYSTPNERTRYIYDGFDRRTSIVDSVGNQMVTQYDSAGNVVRVSRFGSVGGPSPTSDGPAVLSMPVSSGGVIQTANLVNTNLLEATESLYDELSRVFQTDRVLFVNTIPTVRPPNVADGAADIGKGNLTPGDNQSIPGISGVTIIGRVTTRTEYDRKSRRTFIVEDDGDTARTFYDGADRVIKSVDPEGNTVETAYDDNNNDIETRETDVSQVAGVPNEVFLTTNFYDSLNRLQRRVDNVGQTLDYRYDSRNNLVAMADAQGQPGQPSLVAPSQGALSPTTPPTSLAT